MHDLVTAASELQCPKCYEVILIFFAFRTSEKDEKMGYGIICPVCKSAEMASIHEMASQIGLLNSYFCQECNHILFKIVFSVEDDELLFKYACGSCGSICEYSLEEARRLIEGNIKSPKFVSFSFSPN